MSRNHDKILNNIIKGCTKNSLINKISAEAQEQKNNKKKEKFQRKLINQNIQ